MSFVLKWAQQATQLSKQATGSQQPSRIDDGDGTQSMPMEAVGTQSMPIGDVDAISSSETMSRAGRVEMLGWGEDVPFFSIFMLVMMFSHKKVGIEVLDYFWPVGFMGFCRIFSWSLFLGVARAPTGLQWL